MMWAQLSENQGSISEKGTDFSSFQYVRTSLAFTQCKDEENQELCLHFITNIIEPYCRKSAQLHI
jgi:hypothetical protein